MLLFSAMFAKDLEYELEILDFYDPFGKVGKKEAINNAIISGGYKKETFGVEWDSGRSGCGRDVWVCYPTLPGLRIIANDTITYKQVLHAAAKTAKFASSYRTQACLRAI